MRDDDRRWERLPPELFAPLAADRRERYLAVLAVFAGQLLEPALNLEAISRAVRADLPALADDTTLTSVLTQLVDWGLLDESRDESVTYRDPAEFRRRTLQWSLTAAGKATLAGLDAAVAELLESAAGLQAAALDRIASALDDVADLAATPSPDTAAIHLRLAEAESHHKSLVDNLRPLRRPARSSAGRRSCCRSAPRRDQEERARLAIDQAVPGDGPASVDGLGGAQVPLVRVDEVVQVVHRPVLAAGAVAVVVAGQLPASSRRRADQAGARATRTISGDTNRR